MKCIFSLLIFSCLFQNIHAQLNLSNDSVQGGGVSLSPIAQSLIQLSQAIRPESLKGSFETNQASFFSNAEVISSASDLAVSVKTLISYLKKDQFLPHFDKTRFLSSISDAKSNTQASKMLQDLESNIKPSAMSDIWTLQRSGWLSAVRKL